MSTSVSAQAKKVGLRLGGLAALLLPLAAWWQHECAQPNLNAFDPEQMGRRESALWRSYYAGRGLRLGYQMMGIACGQYGFSWWDGTRIAVHSARAALAFRKNTDDPRCLPALCDYYALVRKATRTEFDIQTAATLELQWWKERRQKMAPPDYARTIARLTSLLYGLPAEATLPAAKLRASAMAYRDARRATGLSDDEWAELDRQLTSAYTALKTELSRP
jgi:hypothetical protein